MKHSSFLFSVLLILLACSNEQSSEPIEDVVRDVIDVEQARVALRNIPDTDWYTQVEKTHYQAQVNKAATRKPLFGDLHVHTRYSFDAYVFGTLASPDNAYEFAKGSPIRRATA